MAQATGAFQVTLSGEERTIEFTAQRDSDNKSRGQGHLFNHATRAKIDFQIDCLNVAGNVATVSGRVTKSESTAPLSGVPFYLQVVDNGQGPNHPSHLTSSVMTFLNGSGQPCTAPVFPATLSVHGGNITVR